MQIQINTDHSLEGREALFSHVRKEVEHALSHHNEHITRVEVHLADQDGPKRGSNEIRCVMEARLEGHQPIAVTIVSESVHQAIDGAAEKLAHLLEHKLGKERDERKHRTAPLHDTPATPNEA